MNLFIANLWHKFIIRPYTRICTVLAYAKQGWKTYDWDFAYLLDDIIFKLERIHKSIRRNNILSESSIQKIEFQCLQIIQTIRKYQQSELYADSLESSRESQKTWHQIWSFLDLYGQNLWD